MFTLPQISRTYTISISSICVFKQATKFRSPRYVAKKNKKPGSELELGIEPTCCDAGHGFLNQHVNLQAKQYSQLLSPHQCSKLKLGITLAPPHMHICIHNHEIQRKQQCVSEIAFTRLTIILAF